MNSDIVQQIYPLVDHAKKTIPDLAIADSEALTADLYLGMVKYANKEIPKYLDRLERLENLKKTKGGEVKEKIFLYNLKKQQDGILAESTQKQKDLLNGIYGAWLEKLIEEEKKESSI